MEPRRAGQADTTGIEHLDGLYSSKMVLSRNQAEEQVRAAIQELSVESREIVLLREYEDLS